MKIKKILSVLLTLCLFVNVSFAFDPYADEEIEKKSYKKLYYGIALTLLGGFLAYDGFSLEKVDVSKPSVDFLSVSHSEWVQTPETFKYQLRSGISLNNLSGVTYYNSDGERIVDYGEYEVKKNEEEITNEGDQQVSNYDPEKYNQYTVQPNVLYNNGNVDLRDLTIEVRYKFADGYIAIDEEGIVRNIDEKGRYYDENGTYLGTVANEGYHVAEIKEGTIDYYDTSGAPVVINDERIEKYTYTEQESQLKILEKEGSITWQDIWEYQTTETNPPNGPQREAHFYDSKNENPAKKYSPGTNNLHLGEQSTVLMEVRVKLEKNKQYTPIYETRHKNDLEGVAGVFIGIAGLYFIIDHFFDMHKFNAYAKKHHLNLRVATASNQYKLMLQKRI